MELDKDSVEIVSLFTNNRKMDHETNFINQFVTPAKRSR